MISLQLEIDYDDETVARAVMDSLGPDNTGYVESELQGSKLIFRISSESAGTLRNTADDLMACIKTAEASAGLADGPPLHWDGPEAVRAFAMSEERPSFSKGDWIVERFGTLAGDCLERHPCKRSLTASRVHG